MLDEQVQVLVKYVYYLYINSHKDANYYLWVTQLPNVNEWDFVE